MPKPVSHSLYQPAYEIYGLGDCNNFYAKCQEMFDERLRGKPVVVLSNNDGCIIARNAEAKALGIEMGTAWHLHEKDLRKKGVVPFSSNYTLYGNMSSRVTSIYHEYTPQLEVYSIDESFLNFTGFRDVEGHARRCREDVMRSTGLPICIGLGKTKTLAKIANRYAKKNAFTEGVYSMLDDDDVEWVLSKLDLNDVWGVAKRLTTKLNALGMRTALDLRNADPQYIRDNFNVVVQRICMELKGISCLPLEMVMPERKSVMCSRSFGYFVTDYDQMKEAVSTYVCRGAEKLREAGLVTNHVTVFLQTNYFSKTDPQYHPVKAVTLPVGTWDSRRLITAAHKGLESIWKTGFRYKKAGVLYGNLHQPEQVQYSLLDTEDDGSTDRLMLALDRLNQDYGRNSVTLASSGIKPPWVLRSNFHSPRYTTRWHDIVTAHAR